MTGNEYQELAMRTNDGKASERLYNHLPQVEPFIPFDIGGVLNASLGLSGEVGELNDMIKKWIYHGHELDQVHVEKEIGDVCWYIAMMCESFGLDMDKIMQMNIEKLKARYPDGFSEVASQNRVDGDI